MDSLDIVAVVGSLRRNSFTRRVVRAMQALAPVSIALDIVPLDALTLYNQDEDAAPPQSWVEFRQRVSLADAILFATPEYNRSVPGVLKNALDIGSRPYGQSIWSKKPAAILSVSPGPMGAFGANHHLRQSLVFLDMPTLQQPECYLGGVESLLDDQGHFLHSTTREYMVNFITHFETWIRRQAGASRAARSPIRSAL
jgi:chromate reductase